MDIYSVKQELLSQLEALTKNNKSNILEVNTRTKRSGNFTYIIVQFKTENKYFNNPYIKAAYYNSQRIFFDQNVGCEILNVEDFEKEVNKFVNLLYNKINNN